MFEYALRSLHPVLTDYGLRWFIIACISAFTTYALWMSGVAVDRDAGYVPLAILLFLFFVPASLALRAAVPGSASPVTRFVDLMMSISQLVAVAQVFLPVTYLAAMAGAHIPLLDNTLSWLDATLFGFNWNTAAKWVADRPVFEGVLSGAYFSIYLQALALIVLGSLLRPGDRNAEFIWLALVSLTLTLAVFAFTPALGKLGHVGSYLPVLQEIRSGHWTVLSYAHAEGIVTFPSFHTTLAVFFAYLAGRLDKRLLRVFGPVNAIMLLSIPVIGGHYLADLFGGAAVACVSIVAVRLIQTALAAAPISVRRPEIRRAIDPIIGS